MVMEVVVVVVVGNSGESGRDLGVSMQGNEELSSALSCGCVRAVRMNRTLLQ